jgi:GT2 family glycosyltransferase
MDSAVFVRHYLNLTVTMSAVRGVRRVKVTFWEEFLRVLLHKPVPALAALYWYVTRRRVRGRNRLRVASADLPFAYSLWIAQNECASAAQRQFSASAEQSVMPAQFVVQIHSADGVSEADLQASISSVERQIYREWRLADIATSPTIIASAGKPIEFLVPLRAGDLFATTALSRFAEALEANPAATVLYGDQDRIDAKGKRTRPWFKPQWNEELFLAQDYLTSAVALEGSLAQFAAAQSGEDLSSLLLAATSRASTIVHVPHVLVHVAQEAPLDGSRIEKVARHLAPAGAACAPGPFGTVKVRWPLPEEPPLVSIVIPTKDKLDVLRPCVDSLLARTAYPNFEILIVDNESVEAGTLRFLNRVKRDRRIRVLRYDRPFNYSAINNFAAAQAHGAYLCLLNNDTEVVAADWLTELMRQAVRPHVGAVGAKLLYDDGSIQHAGVTVGIGGAAGHAHRNLPSDQPGFFCLPHVAHFVSAVTGACLAVEKRKFDEVGGFDEEQLAIAFNDVDLCLKLQAAGWRNVYVPHAVLVHHESKSRASDLAPSQLERYQRELAVLQERWGTKTFQDPLHNPNLDRYSETYVMRL